MAFSVLRTCFLIFLLVASSFQAYSQELQSHIRLHSAFEIQTEHGLFYRLFYDYNFPGRDVVHISDIGPMQAKGTLTYLSQTKTIEFRDKDSNVVLDTLEIKDPVRMMSPTKLLPMPDRSQFPEAAIYGEWNHKEAFGLHAHNVLNEIFEWGIIPTQKNDQFQILTTFHELTPLPERLNVQVAALLAYRLNKSGPIEFALRFMAIERRSHSEWREELSDSSMSAVKNFRNYLLQQLENLS